MCVVCKEGAEVGIVGRRIYAPCLWRLRDDQGVQQEQRSPKAG